MGEDRIQIIITRLSRHIAVRREDHQLQVVYFGGRYFIEGKLTFGGMNSPAIYNLPASYLIQMAHKESGLDRRQSVQQLGE